MLLLNRDEWRNTLRSLNFYKTIRQDEVRMMESDYDYAAVSAMSTISFFYNQDSLQQKREEERELIKTIRSQLPWIFVMLKERAAVVEGQEQLQEKYAEYKQVLYEPSLKRIAVYDLEEINLMVTRYEKFMKVKLLLPAESIMKYAKNLEGLFKIRKETEYLIEEVIFRIKDAADEFQYRDKEREIKGVLARCGLKVERRRYNEDYNNVVDFREILAGSILRNTKEMQPNFLIINFNEEKDEKQLRNRNAAIERKKSYLATALKFQNKEEWKRRLDSFYELMENEHEVSFKQQKRSEQTKGRWEVEQTVIMSQFAQRQTVHRKYKQLMNDIIQAETVSQEMMVEVISFYTKVSHIYRSGNLLLRSGVSKEDFEKASVYAKYIAQGINYFYKEGDFDTVFDGNEMDNENAKNKEGSLWSGTFASAFDKEFLVQENYLYNISFMSTTKAREVAMGFIAMSIKNLPNGKPILLQIRVTKEIKQLLKNHPQFRDGLRGYVDINKIVLQNEKTQHEKEVLFSIYNLFKVGRVRQCQLSKELNDGNRQNNGNVSWKYTHIELFFAPHLRLREKEKKGQNLTIRQQNVLEKLSVVQQNDDYCKYLFERGKLQELKAFCKANVDENQTLSINEQQAFLDIAMAQGNVKEVEQYLKKIQQTAQLDAFSQIEQNIKLSRTEELLFNYVSKDEQLEKVMLDITSTQNSIQQFSVDQLLQLEANDILTKIMFAESEFKKGNIYSATNYIIVTLDSLGRSLPFFLINAFSADINNCLVGMSNHQYAKELQHELNKLIEMTNERMIYWKANERDIKLIIEQNQKKNTENQQFLYFDLGQLKWFEEQKLGLEQVVKYAVIISNQLWSEEDDFVAGKQGTHQRQKLRKLKQRSIEFFMLQIECINIFLKYITEMPESQKSKKYLIDSLMSLRRHYGNWNEIFQDLSSDPREHKVVLFATFHTYHAQFMFKYMKYVQKNSSQFGQARKELKKAKQLLQLHKLSNHPQNEKIIDFDEVILKQQMQKQNEQNQKFRKIDELKQSKVEIHLNNSSYLKQFGALNEKLQINLDWLQSSCKGSSADDRVQLRRKVLNINQSLWQKPLVIQKEIQKHPSLIVLHYHTARLHLIQHDYLKAASYASQAQRKIRAAPPNQTPSQRQKRRKYMLNNEMLVRINCLHSDIFNEYANRLLYNRILNSFNEQIDFLSFLPSKRHTFDMSKLLQKRAFLQIRVMQVFFQNTNNLIDKKAICSDLQQAGKILGMIVGEQKSLFQARILCYLAAMQKMNNRQSSVKAAYNAATKIFRTVKAEQYATVAAAEAYLYLEIEGQNINTVRRLMPYAESLKEKLFEKGNLLMEEYKMLIRIAQCLLTRMGPNPSKAYCELVMKAMEYRHEQLLLKNKGALPADYNINYDLSASLRNSCLTTLLEIYKMEKKQDKIKECKKKMQDLKIMMTKKDQESVVSEKKEQTFTLMDYNFFK